jgi:hypothetical protein
MARTIRRVWQRGTMEVVLFAGLFALPLGIHTLARMLA